MQLIGSHTQHGLARVLGGIFLPLPANTILQIFKVGELLMGASVDEMFLDLDEELFMFFPVSTGVMQWLIAGIQGRIRDLVRPVPQCRPEGRAWSRRSGP